MTAYVTMDEVKLLGSMPASDIDNLETVYPGTFAAVADAVSRMFDARLAKRYATPFVSPYPEAIKWHVAQVVAAHLWMKRGYNPGSAQDEAIQKLKDEALAWLKEAADSETGLVELPAKEDPAGDTSGVSKPGPLSYSEQSPYSWTDVQIAAIRGGSR